MGDARVRDSQIQAALAVSAKRDGLMLAQHTFLKTRQEAFEIALENSHLLDRLWWIWDPSVLKARVDVIQQGLLRNADKDMAMAAAKARLQL